MTEVDWDHIRREKERYRQASAALSFDEKLQILERLRERGRALLESRQLFVGGAALERAPIVQTNSMQSSGGGIHLTAFGANTTLVTVAAVTPAAAGKTTTSGILQR